MAYVQNEKSTGLDTLASLANNDLIIVGDVSDSGRAKTITETNFVSQIESQITLNNIPGLIDLTTQVTGVLPLINGGTQSALSDPGANKLWGWDNTDNAIGFWTIGSGLTYDHTTHTLTATGAGSVIYFTDSDTYSDNSGGTVTLNSFGIASNIISSSNTVKVVFIGQLSKNAGSGGTFDIDLNATTLYSVAGGADGQPLDIKLTIELYKDGTTISAYIVEQSWDTVTGTERTIYQNTTTAITLATATTLAIKSLQTGTPGGAVSTEYLLKATNV